MEKNKPQKAHLSVIVAILLYMYSWQVFAQDPQWSVNPAQYNYSMSYIGFVVIGDENVGGPDDRVAAFAGEEVRGVATPTLNEETGQWIFFMMIYSNQNGENLSFKYYKDGPGFTGEIFDLFTNVQFQADGLVGSALDPLATSDVELTGAVIESFALPGQIDSEIIGDTIYVVMHPEVDVTALAASYEASTGALVKVENTVQVSGDTENDFSQIVEYTVRSGNRMNTSSFFVKPDYHEIRMVASVFTESVESASESDTLYAFINDGLKAKSGGVHVEDIDKYRFDLTIPYHGAGGTISYQFYSHADQTITELEQTTAFIPENDRGTIYNPFVFSQPLLTGNQISSFEIPNQYGQTVFDVNDIWIRVDENETDFQLAPIYETSPGAVVMVNDSVQYAGYTVQDFTDPVTYQVYNSEKTDYTEYTVNVVNHQMEMIAAVYLGGEIAGAENDTLYAYSGELLLGQAAGERFETLDQFRFHLTMLNITVDDQIQFKYFDASEEITIDLIDELDFTAGIAQGSDYAPVNLSDTELPGTSFTTFRVEGQFGETLFTDDEIIIRMPPEADLTSLTPEFSTNPGTVVMLEDSIQYSGFTSVDAENALTYILYNYNHNLSDTTVVRIQSNHMRLTAAVITGNQETTGTADSLFAYVDDHHCGTGVSIFVPEINRYRFQLDMLGYYDQGDLSFVFKDGDTGETTELIDHMSFVKDTEEGSLFDPVKLTDEVLSGNEFISFNIENQLFNTVYGNNEILIRMPVEMPLDDLVSEFEVNGHAIVMQNDSVQYSGITSRDFSFPLNYRVYSYDKSSYTDYVVKVVYFYTDLITSVYINDEEIAAEGDSLFAYVDGKLSGVATPVYVEEIDKYRFPLTVISPFESEMITFKFKDEDQGQVYDIIDLEPFEDANKKGSLYNPLVLSNQMMTGNEISSFNIDGQIHETRFEGDYIFIKLLPDPNYKNLIPVFEASAGAVVTVNDSVQYSGVTALSLSDTTTYRVYNYNQTTFTDYKVSVDYNLMNITASVLINGKDETTVGDSLIVYIDGRRSGAATPVEVSEIGKYRFNLDVFHYFPTGEVSYKYRRGSDGQEFDLMHPGYHFINEFKAGTPMNPLVLYNTEISESEMLTFTLEGQMGATVYDGNVVKIIFEPGTDVSNLPAEFTLTDGARMYLADSIQYSALTTNDFTQDVEFTVVNPDNTPAQSFRVQIIFAEYAEIEVSSVLSPNGDKINDNWKINEVEKYRESEFTVFDAHGRIVYESIGYDNSWDGYYNGELLPVGSYFYTIKTPDGKFVKGVLSLVY